MVEVLTVFLSSTAKDLGPYRDAVHARLTASGKFKCIRQEDFTGHHAATVEFCSEQAEHADFYVGLIGMRRGWEPNGAADPRSITEIEYDRAKPEGRFIYVTPDNFPVPGNLRETAEEHQRQLAFRQRVMTRIVSQAEFSTPERLAYTIVEQLLVHLGENNRHTATDELSDTIVAKLMSALDARGEVQRAVVGGLERQTVIKLARRLRPDDALDFKGAVAELDNAITIALDAIARGHRASNEDDFVNDVLKRVGEQTQAGEIDRATKEINDALKELDVRDAEQQERMKRSRIILLEAGIEQDILRRDAKAAAQRVERLVAIEHPDNQEQRFAALLRRQDAYNVEGRDKGINFSLEIAIEIARVAVEGGRGADQRGAALNDLGNALASLGEREAGTTRLEQAVEAFRAALQEGTREHAPLDWAAAQNNLGIALQMVGKRESGTARLEQAIGAYRAALQEGTRERAPLDWAMTQNNLGAALETLGERESDTARLEQAVEAFRAALQERTRDRVPQQWAITQNNLGNALRNLGERETSTARLEQAVAAHRAALQECTRERVPQQWAITQNNLGNALASLGSRESGTARLVEAVEAYRAALQERTRERVPLDWATTQNNLGNALRTLGRRVSGTVRLQQAVEAYRAALEERTRERAPLDWAMTQNNLGNALEALGERESDTARLEQAVEAFRAALEVFEEAKTSHYVEGTRRNLARAEALLAERRSKGG